MSRFASWVLVTYAIAVTGFAAYQYAVIDRLQMIIRLLLSGTPN